jgi:hypothetical protein
MSFSTHLFCILYCYIMIFVYNPKRQGFICYKLYNLEHSPLFVYNPHLLGCILSSNNFDQLQILALTKHSLLESNKFYSSHFKVPIQALILLDLYVQCKISPIKNVSCFAYDLVT